MYRNIPDAPQISRMVQSLYHRFSAQNIERLAALSDGIFAVAMTLLVLDLKVPVAAFQHHQEPV